MKKIMSFICCIILAFCGVNALCINSFADDVVNFSEINTSEGGVIFEANTTFKNNTNESYYINWYCEGNPRSAAITKAAYGGLWNNRLIGPGGSILINVRISISTNESYEEPVIPPVSSPSNVTHTHEWIEGEIYSATQDKDGLGGVYCKSCGAIQSSYPISAYGYSINDYATPMVNASKAGQNITFELGEWNSFPKAFMEKIASKSAEGVTFVFHYKWNHVKQEITIPAGTQVDLNYDWYGPAKMAELYGAN